MRGRFELTFFCGGFRFVSDPNPVSIRWLNLIQFTLFVSAFSVPSPDIDVSASSGGFSGRSFWITAIRY